MFLFTSYCFGSIVSIRFVEIRIYVTVTGDAIVCDMLNKEEDSKCCFPFVYCTDVSWG